MPPKKKPRTEPSKKKVLDAYRERDGMSWDDARLRALDLQYHDMRPDRSVFNKLKMHTMVDHDAGLERDRFDPFLDHLLLF